MKELSELSAPRNVTRKLLEKDVQKKCVDWARARGYWARKVSSQTQRSLPDYMFAKLDPFNGPIKFATEFKAPGKTSTEAQRDEQKAMGCAGWLVWECDDFEDFKTTVSRIETRGA